MDNTTVGMVSLGCTKNQVDAEIMLSLLEQGGFVISADPAECDVVIVNTCGFIEDAKRESIENILEFCQQKGAGKLKVVVVTGCLAERYRDEVAAEIPEADVVLGIGANSDIVAAIRAALSGERVTRFPDKKALPLEGARKLTTKPYTAYIKIAEGCDNRCTYCAIPLIRGGFRSRRMEDVVAEARNLAQSGVKELNVVAQDTTRYGLDLYGQPMLARLLQELCKIEGLHWIRVLYGYPDRINDELIQVFANEPKIVKYIDVPLQHASGKVLKEMNRRGDRESLTALMEKLRANIPDMVLRTTFITGFPGESEADFEELCAFVEDVRFDRLGCFAYSEEEGTPAAGREDQVEEEVRRRRAEIIMERQYAIMEEKNAAQIGRTLEVLCEGYDPQSGLYEGRSYMDAPDIDSRIYFVSGFPCEEGEFYSVVIDSAENYDLTGHTCR
ncbi:30S ribosomal protein S12 methylthiotransferase RimO [Zongyangia hominis]|uniref:Ribosomal protein uS12 methylthiotransferase RimO n=1 Tax=Zongyangia hominis TaxID=2763677 RepID=A0A926ED60_9FIRM|nr:30S ribosomal protein S12 methylthiotransferase RimO [Zongyangia hominis]MBC8570895.1 30S ribosomal protein S12 methylthiotransferase RimO [Zongyangia hominis]